MLLQIHDELIFECLKKDEVKVKKLIKEAMALFQPQIIICFLYH